MNIAVTGSKGFLGRRLVEALRSRGHCVTEVPRGTDPYLLFRDSQPRLVYHLAASYDPRPDFGAPEARLLSDNVVYAGNIASAAAWCGSVARVVYCATPRQHGPEGKPVGLYGASKAAGQLVFESYAAHYETHSVMIGDTFGPGDTRGKVIQKIVEAAVCGGLPLSLPEGKCINPIAVGYVADALCARQIPTNLLGPPQNLIDVQEQIRATVVEDWEPTLRVLGSIPADDPFPNGIAECNQHYKTFWQDLKDYVKDYQKS